MSTTDADTGSVAHRLKATSGDTWRYQTANAVACELPGIVFVPIYIAFVPADTPVRLKCAGGGKVPAMCPVRHKAEFLA